MDSTALNAAHLLLRHLKSLAARGKDRVSLSPESARMLREIPALVTGKPLPKAPVAVASPERDLPATGSLMDAYKKLTQQGSPAPTLTKVKETEPQDLPLPRDLAREIIKPEGATREEKLAHVEKLAAACAACRDMGTLHQTMVFATGNPHARLMFVGEAPGAEEEKMREPFVGPAGQLLTKIIGTMGLSRNDVYITNIVKYRPAMENQGTKNRPPTAMEMAAGIPYLKAEIAIVEPEVIIALGATAAAGLLGRSNVSVSALRGKIHRYEGHPLLVTYHPSYLLRTEDQGAQIMRQERRKVWEDLLKAMEILKMPINEKQRNFFL